MKLVTLLFLISTIAFGQKLNISNNPLGGRIVFEEKGCIECHSLSGFGGTYGPDLMKHQYYGSFSELAALIWNHIPQMNRMFRKLHKDRPNIDNKEMERLVVFIYYLHYLGKPGSVSKGKKLLNSKGCLECHTINTIGLNKAPDFAKIEFNVSPLYMVQIIWNHFNKMSQKFLEEGKSIPKLSGENIVDISAYIKVISLKTVNTRMSTGNPNNGEKIFAAKECIKCHDIINVQSDKMGPSLKQIDLHLSVSEIGALMWNHAGMMKEMMDENEIKWPEFQGYEMADLIAYLYFLDFQDEPGNFIDGKKVFEEKRCIVCHDSDESSGPNLINGIKLKSPIQLITKIWNHSTAMEDQILTFNENWPILSAEDIRNLYSYLTSN